jgi:RNA polymerase sigma factor (sigma-70 family)
MSLPPESPTEQADPTLGVVVRERRQLTGIAYRLLGSAADAEDVVQEAYARWYSLAPEMRQGIDAPAAWLTKVATRICLDQLGSARARRERYVGEWIPEPLPGASDWAGGPTASDTVDPVDRVTLDESINIAFLVVLQSMTPAERVAFVLHDVFRYSFADVSEVVGRTPAACRQLASSARRRIRTSAVSPSLRDGQAAIVRAFKVAWDAKDIDALVDLLDPHVVATADSGGAVRAALRPIRGARQVAHHLVGEVARGGDLSILERTVNGQAGVVVQVGGATVAVFAFGIARQRITHVWAVRNPDKLRRWAHP